LAKLRAVMAGFAPLRPFIERFAATVRGFAEVLEILKNKGLNQQRAFFNGAGDQKSGILECL
jgi:hypothetical protein